MPVFGSSLRVAASLLVAALICLERPPAFAGQPPAEADAKSEEQPRQAFTGSNRCFSCHRRQAATWADTKHAKAYEILPAKYRNDASCLKCHTTAYGEPTGFVMGGDPESAKPFLSVGCETCHGPGALHEVAVAKWTDGDPADEERLMQNVKATTIRMTADHVCAKCHRTQGHEKHPPYDGQRLVSTYNHVASTSGAALAPAGRSWSRSPADPCQVAPRQTSSAAHLARGAAHGSSATYTVKTCGSCHYDRYKQWGAEKHAHLAANLPARYSANRDCAECHPHSGRLAAFVAAASEGDAAPRQHGAACETCHGAAGEHVAFAKRLINTSISRELELAARKTIRKNKPAAACVQCHSTERHQEHPEFERSAGPVQQAARR
jgi:hypothetical protein